MRVQTLTSSPIGIGDDPKIYPVLESEAAVEALVGVTSESSMSESSGVSKVEAECGEPTKLSGGAEGALAAAPTVSTGG